MAKKNDCICRPDDDGGILYNPRCLFHKGPDAGYGYDEWGRPSSKHSETVGKVAAGVIVVSLLAAIGFVVAVALGAFG